MKKEIAEKWIEALRSGKYKQGTEALRTQDGCYCCLGVLCDISGLSKFDQFGQYGGKAQYPNANVMSWAGLDNQWGWVKGKFALYTLNDEGTSFEEIANLIEKNWEKL